MEADTQSLRDLLTGIISAADLARTADLRIAGVFDDSRKLAPGGLFVALPGVSTDGRRFIDDAILRGAAAIVTEGPAAAPLTDNRRPVFAVADARLAIAVIAARWYGLTREKLAN